MHKEHASVAFLQKLNREEQQALEAIATRVCFSKKEYIFQSTLTNDTVYILVQGRVKLFRLSALGQECIQWFCFPGDVFGLSEHTYDHDSGLYAQALVASIVWAITKTEFNQLLLNKPTVALYVVDHLSSRVRTLGDMLLHVTCGNAYTRLVNLLQRFSQLYGSSINGEIYVDMQLTHQDIADMIGVCRQTVSSLMSDLKRLDVISSNRHGITIKNVAKLNTLINPRLPGNFADQVHSESCSA